MATGTTFGEFIRSARLAAGLGLREAARALDKSPSYLSRLEGDDVKPPSGGLLLHMARLYRVSIHDLVERAEDRRAEVMAADKGVESAVHAFYRIAHDQTPETQMRMLKAALAELELDEQEKQDFVDRFRAMLSRAHGRELLRLSKGEAGLFAFDIEPRRLPASALRDRAIDVLCQVYGTEIPIPVQIETVVEQVDPGIKLVVCGEMGAAPLDDGSPSVLGMSRWSRDGEYRELCIHKDLFEADEPSTRRRANFTLAHELFHCLEHLPLVKSRNPDLCMSRKVAFATPSPHLGAPRWYQRGNRPRRLRTSEDWREWQANTFAAELLMPAPVVEDLFYSVVGADQVQVDPSQVAGIADGIARTDLPGERIETMAERFDVNPQAMAIRLMKMDLVVPED